MKLLVMGGCHTYGFGVDSGRGFMQQVATALGEFATEVTVHYYAPLKMSRIEPLLAKLDNQLSEYDLILLQPGHFELIHTHFLDLFRPVPADLNPEVYRGHRLLDAPTQPVSAHLFQEKLRKATDEQIEPYLRVNSRLDQLRRLAKRTLLKLAHQFGYIERLAYIEQKLNDVLRQLEPYGNRVVLVTPMPVCDEIVNELRQMVCRMFVRQGEAAGVTVVDSFESLSRPHASLLAEDGCHLNVFGHTQLTEAVLQACRQLNLLSLKDQNTILELLV